MKNSDLRLDRLLRAAAAVPNEQPPEVPFGFDTRVLAHLRASPTYDSLDIARLLRRVVLTSLAVVVIAGAGAYRELSQPLDLGEPFTDEDVIADSAIGLAFEQ
jgi:hypothetical protein